MMLLGFPVITGILKQMIYKKICFPGIFLIITMLEEEKMKRERFTAWIVFALTAMVILAGCSNGSGGSTNPGGSPTPGNPPVTPVEVEAVTLNESSFGLFTGGDSGSLTAAISPENATQGTDLTWAVTPQGIVTLSATTGSSITVSPAAEGSAKITVTTGNGKTASCTITVIAGEINVAVRTQPYANAGSATANTPDNPAIIKLINGKWTAGGTPLRINSGTRSQPMQSGPGMSGTTLLWVNKPMKKAYTFRAKISWPNTNAASTIFGEFVNPDTVLSNMKDAPLTWTSRFDMGRSNGAATAAEPGYRGLAGIRFGEPTDDKTAATQIVPYALVSCYAPWAAAAGTLSTAVTNVDITEFTSATTPITYDARGFTRSSAEGALPQMLELSWSPVKGHSYKIFVNDGSGNFTPVQLERGGGASGTTDALTYNLSQLHSVFEERDVDVFPGIMLWTSGRYLEIHELELIIK
jgi:hypothetical protein